MLCPANVLGYLFAINAEVQAKPAPGRRLPPGFGRSAGTRSRRIPLRLARKRKVDLRGVESHDNHLVDDNHRRCHIPKFLEVGQGTRILRNVLFLKLDALLRKILFHLVTEYSTMLGIYEDVVRHFSTAAWFMPACSKFSTAFCALPIARSTGSPA
jgi:hypothetical protein